MTEPDPSAGLSTPSRRSTSAASRGAIARALVAPRRAVLRRRRRRLGYLASLGRPGLPARRTSRSARRSRRAAARSCRARDEPAHRPRRSQLRGGAPARRGGRGPDDDAAARHGSRSRRVSGLPRRRASPARGDRRQAAAAPPGRPLRGRTGWRGSSIDRTALRGRADRTLRAAAQAEPGRSSRRSTPTRGRSSRSTAASGSRRSTGCADRSPRQRHAAAPEQLLDSRTSQDQQLLSLARNIEARRSRAARGRGARRRRDRATTRWSSAGSSA